MLFQQACVLAICFPYDVEDIAEKWHGADHQIDADIAEHSRKREARRAGLPGVVHDEKRDRARHYVAKSGKQTEDRVPAEAERRPGHFEAVVHQAREPLHLRESLLVTHAGGEPAQEFGGTLARNFRIRGKDLDTTGSHRLLTLVARRI